MTSKAEAKSELKSTLMLFKMYPSERKAESLRRMVKLLKIVESKVKDFVKTVFKPATSFNDFANKFTGKIFDNFGVSKNANLDVCNEAAEAMLDVTDRFEVGERLGFFGNASQSPFRGSKMTRNAGATYNRLRSFLGKHKVDGIVIPVSITSDSVKKQKEKSNGMYDAKLPRIKEWIQAHSRISNEVKEKAKELKRWRWSVSTDFKGTAYHEMGHKIHLSADIDGLDQLIREAHNQGWSTVLSEYAKTNHKEFFAETFCAYMLGEHEFIEPRLLAKLKELDKSL
ncbi:hypothetical protein [Vibrio europaeus]|uniref:hypothetical protein n=1 Tax=Vibrio europaeus TaxID=300876 RepID=UPI00233EA1B4|nr:hypothetical protein [Vibrio europaeus]MDC5753532.1 hypothetical protein [Vibrio europaeus]MDC5816555.1 hypothetical protein [Vibrio europaeus]